MHYFRNLCHNNSVRWKRLVAAVILLRCSSCCSGSSSWQRTSFWGKCFSPSISRSSPSQSFIVVIFSWFVSWRAPLTDVWRSVVSTGRLVLSQQLFSLLVFSNAVTTSSCCSRGGPSLGRPPPMPFMSLLESLNNVSGFQHVVICLDPQNHFFIQHLSEVHNLSNKSSMCLFFILQLVS